MIDKKIILRQIGAKIAYFRTLTGISQSELAKKVCTTQSTISKVEAGNYNNNLSINLLVEIADAMSLDPSMLMSFTSYEKSMWSNQIAESVQ